MFGFPLGLGIPKQWFWLKLLDRGFCKHHSFGLSPHQIKHAVVHWACVMILKLVVFRYRWILSLITLFRSMWRDRKMLFRQIWNLNSRGTRRDLVSSNGVQMHSITCSWFPLDQGLSIRSLHHSVACDVCVCLCAWICNV